MSKLYLKLFNTEVILLATGGLLLVLHLLYSPPPFEQLLPATVYRFKVNMTFEKPDSEVSISTYLPVNDERQSVINETLSSASLLFSQQETPAGMIGHWEGDNLRGIQEVSYSADLVMQAIHYDISPDLPIQQHYDKKFDHYLQETSAIQVNNKEILELWQHLMPKNPTVLSELRAIFDYTHKQLETTEFKGYTDALTALRLGQASCNGKSRLFVALARLNHLPARLVGGVILNNGSKKTSHQWVEVNIKGRWVPFDPTNGHFAELPHHYLTLYRGDKVMFKHTSDINFDYRFVTNKSLKIRHALTQNLDQIAGINDVESNKVNDIINKFLFLFGGDSGISEILVLFPLAALLVTLCRNVIGITSFGVFLPMLIAASCRYTGLIVGLSGFLLVISLAGALRLGMNKLNMLQIPRLAAMITIVTSIIFLIAAFSRGYMDSQLAFITLFPVIILSFTAERLVTVSEQRGYGETIKLMTNTLIIILICYGAFQSVFLQGIFLNFPELLFFILAMQIALGRWEGLRVTEFLRFRKLLKEAKAEASKFSSTTETTENKLLGINARNLSMVQRLNNVDDIAVSNDKVLSKKILAKHGVPVPKTLTVLEDFWDIHVVEKQLQHWHEFVIKPGQGAQGNGIAVIVGHDNEDFILAGGKRWNIDKVKHHIREIIAGVYSNHSDRDVALIETLLIPAPFYRNLFADGLSDLRLVLIEGKLSAAMLRIPTSLSQGKANLHQGAIGVAIDITTGRTFQSMINQQLITHHPDTGVALNGLQLENWEEIIDVACQAQQAIPLGYIGVDICVDIKQGPLVLEVNARPGLEIQNIHGSGFRDQYEKLISSPSIIRGQ